MINNDEAERRKRLNPKNVLSVLILLICIVLTAWTLITVSTESDLRPASFVTLPITPLSRTGQSVSFTSVSAISQNGVAVGVRGVLKTLSGQPVAGAQVYASYYLQGQYRAQVGTTDQNGYFEIRFPMNWTGWLSLTLAYFGDAQHQGVRMIFSVFGEGL